MTPLSRHHSENKATPNLIIKISNLSLHYLLIMRRSKKIF